ncbi:MAG: CCA tRNA nucleotidyltransferase [Helicobacteraceae bacterium]|nr:CCA tRNA nucleotidyltransferase [Candidatus Sulfurimonas ponti]MBL6973408.1 CCA tRNA nucleotidyltransferase [Sulfurimonas sp.]
MKEIVLFDYPNNLDYIFDKLNKNGIKSIIVGGYIRDKFLNLNSKDIDIELFGVTSYAKLEKILQEFGEVNTVGKSFGVCKLSLKTLDLDFTLPRRDNKIGSGHCGFEITVDNNLDFKTASSRRDFTMNAIGFDLMEKKILDPFNGQEDIKNKILRAVNIDTFSEDPLRVLRAVGFASRFDFTLEHSLFVLCKEMCEKNLLDELAKERIYTELEKILLKSKKPSSAFSLLKKLKALVHFPPLERLENKDFSNVLESLDKMAALKTKNKKTNMQLMLSVLCYKFTKETRHDFITNLTNDKKTLNYIDTLLDNSFSTAYTDSDILRLATKVNIEHFLLFSQAIHKEIAKDVFVKLKQRAIGLNVLNQKPKAYLQGKDILDLGLEPSKEFSVLLKSAYEAQINLEINSKDEALQWLKKEVKNSL